MYIQQLIIAFSVIKNFLIEYGKIIIVLILLFIVTCINIHFKRKIQAKYIVDEMDSRHGY